MKWFVLLGDELSDSSEFEDRGEVSLPELC